MIFHKLINSEIYFNLLHFDSIDTDVYPQDFPMENKFLWALRRTTTLKYLQHFASREPHMLATFKMPWKLNKTSLKRWPMVARPPQMW